MFVKNTNKTLTSDVRASGSIAGQALWPRATALRRRFCIDIDAQSAFDQCSAGFSVCWKALTPGQLAGIFRSVVNPPMVHVAYSDRSV